MQDMKKKLRKIRDVARQDVQYAKHFPPERCQRHRQQTSASAQDHRSKQSTGKPVAELKLLVAAVAHFAGVATATGVVVIKPQDTLHSDSFSRAHR